MASKGSVDLGGIKSFWFSIIALGVFGVGLSIYLYRLKFGGELSSEASDWSAFGSFVGGVLGPLVSFLTLLAVLKTVYLQRELLDSQVDEFLKLDIRQKEAAEKQDRQLELAKAELSLAKAQAYLTIQLQFIENLRQHYRREADALGDAIKLVLAEYGSNAEVQQSCKGTLDKKEEIESKIATLVALSLELSFFEYSTSEEIRKAIGVKVIRVMYGDEYLKANGLA